VDRVRPPREALADLRPYTDAEIPAEVILSANENPAQLPPELMERIARLVKNGCALNRYPDPMATELRELIAEANGLEPGNVLVGNGGDELIFDLFLGWGGPGRKMLDMPPTFVMYGIDAKVTGTERVVVQRTADFEVDAPAVLERLAQNDIDLVMIADPNNPTGSNTPETVLLDIINATDAHVLIDEAYFEFSRETSRQHLERHEPVRRVEVILAALVDHADVSLALGLCIGKHDVELVALERCLVALVLHANREARLRLALVCHA
jgi:histidinol-phosphate aminotransferase